MRCAQEVEDRNKDQGARKENRIRDLSSRGVESAHFTARTSNVKTFIIILGPSERDFRPPVLIARVVYLKLNAKAFILFKLQLLPVASRVDVRYTQTSALRDEKAIAV